MLNCDGGIDGSYDGNYFDRRTGGDPPTDVNTDGGVDLSDSEVEYSFERWVAGC
jgi:hypothetical protein